MFTTEHLTGRIQCVDGDFVCINLHYNSIFDVEKFFIDQMYINKESGNYVLPEFFFKTPSGLTFNNTSLKDEMISIIDKYYETRKKLKLD